MKIILTSSGNNLESETSEVFGRAPYFIFADTETDEISAHENPALSASGGAGIQAAQFVTDLGAEAVINGNIGPKALKVIQTAGIKIFQHEGKTVAEVVNNFKAGKLSEL